MPAYLIRSFKRKKKYQKSRYRACCIVFRIFDLPACSYFFLSYLLSIPTISASWHLRFFKTKFKCYSIRHVSRSVLEKTISLFWWETNFLSFWHFYKQGKSSREMKISKKNSQIVPVRSFFQPSILISPNPTQTSFPEYLE